MLSRSELAVRCHCLSGRSNDAESANETTTIETTTADNCGIIVLKSGSPREQVCQAPGQLAFFKMIIIHTATNMKTVRWVR